LHHLAYEGERGPVVPRRQCSKRAHERYHAKIARDDGSADSSTNTSPPSRR
jgi:hypothetical protein